MAKIAQASASASVAALAALMNNGTLVMYSGTQPANPDTALSGNTALATFTFAAAAFGTPALSSGNMKASATFVNATVTPVASGTATFARAFQSNGTTVVGDFTVGTSATDVIIASTTVVTTTNLNCTSFYIQQPCD